jgi:hypothetical protein
MGTRDIFLLGRDGMGIHPSLTLILLTYKLIFCILSLVHLHVKKRIVFQRFQGKSVPWVKALLFSESCHSIQESVTNPRSCE